MKILVTGSNGQLGYDVLKELHRRKIPCRGIDREECDITNMPQVMHWVETYQPDAVIHCAAYTNVNRAETEQTLCMDINYRGSANIAAAANKTGAKLIYISTDYVFGASGEQPLGIYEAKNPLNTYGETKLSGENSTRILCPRSFIVRTSWVFGINGSNFVKTMLRLGREKEEISVVSDQIGSPTYTADLAPLLCDKYSERCMFCTDDKHPNDLLEKGHIDYIVKRAIGLGVDPITAVKVACHNAARYFLLNNRGAIAPGYLGDFVIIDSFQDFNIERVFKKGELMVDHGVVKDFPAPAIDPYLTERAHSTFHVEHLTAEDFTDARPRGIIGMVNGEITTVDAGYSDRIDVEYDVLKIAVVERHKNTHHIGIGFLQGYGLKSGAVATSVSHDSHNIIVVGTSEDDCAAAANREQ